MSTQPSPILPWMVMAIGSIALVLHLFRGRRGDLVSPYTMTLLLMLSIFAIRPLLMLSDGNYQLYGLDVRWGYNTAALVGTVGLSCILAGYYVGGRINRSPANDRTPSRSLPPTYNFSIYRAALLSGLLTTMWFGIMLSRGGGTDFLATLFQGRSAHAEHYLSGLPIAVGALPTAGAVLVGTVRVLAERSRNLSAGERLAFWSVIGASVVPPMALGTRRYLLPCLLVAALATMARRYKSPIRLSHIVLGSAGFIAMAIVPFIRAAGARSGDRGTLNAFREYIQAHGFEGTLRPFFASHDTEMFSYIALVSQRLGESIPWGWGRGTIGEALVNPFPASAAPYPLWSDEVLRGIWGAGCQGSGGFCPVASWAGVAYFDFGLFGVAIAGVLIGLACRRYPHWLFSAWGSRLVVVLGTASFTPVLIRGNTVAAGYITAITIVGAALLLRFCQYRVPFSEAPPACHLSRRKRLARAGE